MSGGPAEEGRGYRAGAVRLREQALSGVRWTSFASAVRILAQFAQLAILARLLTPSDFGNMAVVFAVIAFTQIFADMGVSNAIITRGDITASRLSSLYWLNIVASACVALVLVIAGPWVASFYGEPVLQPLLALAGLYLLVTASWQQLRILAEKDLRFGPLAKIEIAAAIAGLAVSVAMAWMGAGVYSIMAGVLAVTATGAVLGWVFLARGWRPQFVLRLSEIRDYLAFGAYMIGNDLANTVSSHIDVVLGARILGAPAIGLYSVPKNLCLQIIGAINPVVTRVGLPVMARAHDDAALMKTIYLQTMRMTASACFPIFAALAIFAPEMVRLLFGPQWDAAIPLLQIFAWWALMRSTVNPVGGLVMAVGRVDLAFKWNLIWLAICVPAVLAGSQFGVQGLAVTLAGISLMTMIASWYFLVRPLSGAGLIEYFREIAVPLVISAAAGLAGYVAALPFSGDFVRLACGVACGAVVYLALSRFFNREWLSTTLEMLKIG